MSSISASPADTGEGHLAAGESAKAEKPVVALGAPVVEVTLLEDRAHVVRRGKVDLPAGEVRVSVDDVAPTVSDKTLTARIVGPAGAAEVHDVRAVRFTKALREDRPAETGALEESLGEAQRELYEMAVRSQVLGGELEGLDRLEELVISELAEDAAWDRDGRSSAGEALGRLDERCAALRAEMAELSVRTERQRLEVRDAEARLYAALNPGTRSGARLHADLRTDAAGSCEIQFDYVVPGACWRPWHVADLNEGPSGTSLRFRSEGCVWQNTGEDWKGVRLFFSTQRPSLGTEPPRLASDELAVQKKAEQVQVAVREQEIQDTGMGTGRSGVAELPGIDDGGEVISLQGTDAADIPSDGRPYRVPYGEFETGAEGSRVLMPELAACAFFKTVQANAGKLPVLAGPVDLLRRGGFVGRTQAKFVAPGEQFPLGWGPEGTLRVSRDVESKEEEPGLMSSWRATRHRVTLKLSNIGAGELDVLVAERVPVSEIEQVEIRFDAGDASGGQKPDENGFVKWDVHLGSRGHKQLNLAYTYRKRKNVVG